MTQVLQIHFPVPIFVLEFNYFSYSANVICLSTRYSINVKVRGSEVSRLKGSNDTS